ncbi:MAG: ABC transporter ATP-binding protein [Chthoniobacterales bacterium]
MSLSQICPSEEPSQPTEFQFRRQSPWRTMVGLYRPHTGRLVLATVFFLFKTSPLWAMPLITANVIDIVSSPGPDANRSLLINAAVLVFLLALNVPGHALYIRFMSQATRDVEASLRESLIRRLQQLSISFYKRTSAGALQSKVLRDVEAVDQTARLIIDGGLSAITTIIISVVITAIRAPQFLLIFLVTVPILTILRKLLSEKLKHRNHEFRTEIEGMSAHVAGMIEMIPITRAHAVEHSEIERMAHKLGSVRSAGLRLDVQNALFQSAAWTAFNFFTMFSLILSAWLAYTKIIPLTPGDVVMLSAYFATISNSVLGLANMLPMISKGFESLHSIGEVLENPDTEKNIGKATIDQVRGQFAFQNVTFTHPGASRGSIHDFSLTVAPGETIGVVGPSGSGKSTLISLILGFDRPDSGKILLDGQDMNAMDLRSFRRFVGVVAQESILFHGTLRDNVDYGNRKVSDDQIWQALEAANALDFVEKLPDVLDTIVGERGSRLSGGQKQRIAIARAILRDPRVLILDEATSALDVASEAVVQSALERLMIGRTTFVVAHRLSTIRKADRIIVLEEGRIAEHGTPQELRNLGGKYAEMCNLQNAG